MKRLPSAELLDTDSGTPAEISASLADLKLINRIFGGITTTENMIRRVSQKLDTKSLSLLEVAAGAGYVPQLVQERLRKDGIDLKISLLDRAWSHLHNGDGQRAVAGDALALPFQNNSFDLVACNLFTHHLSPTELVTFVNEALRVCRSAVLINDLVRHRLHMAFVYAGLPLFRSRITWHDAPASVRQSYTKSEMGNLLKQTTAARIDIQSYYLFRMGAIAWKKYV